MQALTDGGHIACLPGGRIIEPETCVFYIGDDGPAWIKAKLDQ